MRSRNNITNKKEGFALLFAVLAGGLALTVGLSIANIAVKEVILSSAGRESQFAFYAADSGAECALYWDLQESDVFPTREGGARVDRIKCNGGDVILNTVSESLVKAVTEFTLPLASPSCAEVQVTKRKDAFDNLETIIESRGKNDCDNLSNPNRVERAIRVRY